MQLLVMTALLHWQYCEKGTWLLLEQKVLDVHVSEKTIRRCLNATGPKAKVWPKVNKLTDLHSLGHMFIGIWRSGAKYSLQTSLDQMVVAEFLRR